MLIQRNTNNTLANIIYTFTKANCIVIQTILLHSTQFDDVNDVVALFIATQGLVLYNINAPFSEPFQEQVIVKDPLAETALIWIIWALQIWPDTDMMPFLWRVRTFQSNQPIALIFLLESNDLNPKLQIMMSIIISTVRAVESVVIFINSLEIMSVFLNEASLKIIPYINPNEIAIMSVSTGYNVATVSYTDHEKIGDIGNNCLIYLQGYDIWMALLLVKMLNKTAKTTACLPRVTTLYPFLNEFLRSRTDSLRNATVKHNTYLEQASANICICNELNMNHLQIRAEVFNRPENFRDLYPHWNVKFSMLVPNDIDNSYVSYLSMIKIYLHNIFPLTVTMLRRLAQTFAKSDHTPRSFQSYYFDTVQIILCLPSTRRAQNRADRFLKMFTSVFAMFMNSSVMLLLLNMQLMTRGHVFSSEKEVLLSHIPIYALENHIDLCWSVNETRIQKRDMKGMMELMYEDGGQVALIMPTVLIDWIERYYGIGRKSFRMLPVPIGHKFASYSIPISSIRLAERLKYVLMQTADYGFKMFYDKCNDRMNYRQWYTERLQDQRTTTIRGGYLLESDMLLALMLYGFLSGIVVFVCELKWTKLRNIWNIFRVWFKNLICL